MFTNKKDPLVDSVRKVMEQNELRRQVESALNEELGISSRKAVPHEHLASYDAMLEEAYKNAIDENALIKAVGTALMRRGTSVANPSSTGIGPYTGRPGSVYGGKLEPIPPRQISGPPKSTSVQPRQGVAFKTPTPEEPNIKEKPPTQPADKKAPDETKYTLLPGSNLMIPVGGGEGKDAGNTVKDYGGIKFPEYVRNQYGDYEGRGMPVMSVNEKVHMTKADIAGMRAPRNKVDAGDLSALRRGEHRLEEKLTKSMSAGDVISDFVHSKNPKFEGKSKKERMEMALGAYYSKHPEKSKKMNEEIDYRDEDTRAYLDHAEKHFRGKETPHADILSKETLDSEDVRKITGSNAGRMIGKYTVDKMNKVHAAFRNKMAEKSAMEESVESIMEEIRTNLEEQLVSIYESGDEQMFEEFVSSLTEEQLEILGLNEVFGDYAGDPSILSRASRQVYSNQQRQAAGQRTMSVGRPAPTATRPAPAARPSPAVRPAPAAKPAPQQYGPKQSPSDMGAPPPGSPMYKGAQAAGRADLTEPAKSKPAIPSTAAASDKALSDAGSVARAQQTAPATANADLTQRPRPSATPRNIGQSLDSKLRGLAGDDAARGRIDGGATSGKPSDSTETPKPEKKSSPTMSTMAGFYESSHIKESLESFIRNKFIKG